MDNNYIDEMVRDSIGEYEMAFDSADWDAMEEHLETDNQVRRKLYATKAIEACLMLVTVWTIMQFVEMDNSASYQPTLIEHQEKLPPAIDSEQIIPLETDENLQDVNSEKNIQQQKEWNLLLKNVPIANSALKTVETTTIEAHVDRIIQVNDNKESKNIDFKKIIDQDNATPIASLAPKMFDVNDKVFLKRIDLGLDQEDGIQKEKAHKYRIAGHFGTNVFNKLIQDESSYLRTASSDNQKVFNILGGVIIDRQLKEKLRIETGAILAYQKNEVTSSSIGLVTYSESMSTISTSSIEIPVNVLYEICRNEKNAIYVLGGLSNYLRLSVGKEYDYSNQANQTNSDPMVLDNTVERIDGLLMTKEMPDNHYASVNVGAGYERKLNKRLSLFAQATFKRSFGKIGVDQDDMAIVSLSAGVKSIL